MKLTNVNILVHQSQRELQRASGKLICNSRQRLTKAWSRRCSITVSSTVANKVRVIEHVKAFNTSSNAYTLSKMKVLFDKWREIVDRATATRIATDNRTVNYR